MLGASIYIAVCSARNRIAVRLRRLREPRYLIGAALAVAYFVVIAFVPRRSRRRRAAGGFPPALALDGYGLPFGGAGLLLMSCVAWLFPTRSHLLTFTDAEVSFLFPAPVSRRQLVVHRVIRAQLGLLFAALLPVFLVVLPGAETSLWRRLLFGIALWVMLATTRVYYAGVTMARDHLRSSDPRARRTAWAPLLVTVGALAVVGVSIWRAVPIPVGSVPDAIARITDVTTTGLPRIVLWPLRLLLGPFFADGVHYLPALAGSLCVFLAATVWVLKCDEVFQAAGSDHVTTKAAAHRGRTTGVQTLRWSGWPLPLSGRAETAFFWKNGMATLRGTSFKSLLPIAILLVYAVVGTKFGMTTSLASAVCLASLMVAAFATLLGPGNVMSDLRGDLRHMELLKTWPVKGGAVVRGEMLWPGTLVTGSAWLALTCALVLSPAAFPEVSLVWRLSLYFVAMVLVPAFVFAQYTIHQTAAVLFPAWIPPDNDMRGFESMAQRLVLFAGVVLALVVMVGPGIIAGGIIAFASYRLTGSPLVLVPSAGICLAIVTIEVVLASEALGPAYDRIDLSGVERAE